MSDSISIPIRHQCEVVPVNQQSPRRSRCERPVNWGEERLSTHSVQHPSHAGRDTLSSRSERILIRYTGNHSGCDLV